MVNDMIEFIYEEETDCRETYITFASKKYCKEISIKYFTKQHLYAQALIYIS